VQRLLIVVIVAGLVLVTWLLASSRELARTPPQRAGGRPSSADPLTHARLERLNTVVGELSRRVEYLEEELRSVKSAFRESLARRAPGSGEEFSLRSYLDEYVRSFSGGGGGSEYFRLAVDAYAVELSNEILAILRDPSSPAALRGRLVQMLTSPRFRGDHRVAQAFLELVERGPDAIRKGALEGLAVIGTGSTAESLERLVPHLRSPPLVKSALATIARLAGERANAIARRLFHAAPDDSTRIAILQQVQPGDAETAVDLFRDAWRRDVPVRIAVAVRLGRFVGEPFRGLVNELLDAEQDERVRKVLEQARKRQSAVPAWHALKATGPADATPPNRDHPNAWASARGNMGLQWLELGYQRPMRAHSVRIYEVNSAGAVARVETVDAGGVRRTVWEGDDPTPKPGVFEVRFAATPYRVAKVRIVLDTDRHPSWNEIDAVELVGPDGRAWAATATASSTYGQS
jgi:hypothetical protein